MIAILLLGVIPVEIVPTAEVDQVWQNASYNPESGDKNFDQLIYWRWYGEDHRCDGFKVNSPHTFEYDPVRRRWFRISIDNGRLHKITTKAYFVVPSVGDPEVDDREKLGKDDRIGPIFWPPLELTP